MDPQVQTHTQSIETQTSFVYNYTCADSIMRAYIPLYLMMYLFLLAKSAMNIVFLFWDLQVRDAVDIAGEKRETKREWAVVFYFKNLLLRGMPHRYLYYSCAARKKFYQEGKYKLTFPTSTPDWISKGIPVQLVTVLILLNFGLLAPLLGVVVASSIVMDGYVQELMLGRFLVKELSVVETHERRHQHKEKSRFVTNDGIYMSDAARKVVESEAEDAEEPWGAIAALAEVESQCKDIPASAFDRVRLAYAMVTAIVLSFVINDIYNSEVGEQKYHIWASMVAFCMPLLVYVVNWLLYKRKAPHSSSTALSRDAAAAAAAAGTANRAGEREGQGEQVELVEIYVSSVLEETLNPVLLRDRAVSRVSREV